MQQGSSYVYKKQQTKIVASPETVLKHISTEQNTAFKRHQKDL